MVEWLMRAIICAILLISCGATQLFAQAEKRNDSTSFGGKKAVMLSVSGAISSTEFSGGIGGKYWISDNYFMKVIVEGRFQQSTSDTSSMDAQGKIAGYIYLARKLYSSDQLFPYVGIGAGIGSTHNDVAGGVFPLSLDYGWNLFGSGTILFGVEYLVSANVSISAEEMIIAEYAHSSLFNGHYWAIGSTASTVNLCIYF
jgi:hypothetical protein